MEFKIKPEQDRLLRFGISFVKMVSRNFQVFTTYNGKKIVEKKWNYIKNMSKYLFGKTGFSNYLTDSDLPEIQLNMYPKLSHGYFSEFNSIRFNIPTLFFSTATDGSLCFKPEFQNTAILLHELDHFKFCKEYNMIEKVGEEMEKFDE